MRKLLLAMALMAAMLATFGCKKPEAEDATETMVTDEAVSTTPAPPPPPAAGAPAADSTGAQPAPGNPAPEATAPVPAPANP